MQRLLTQTVARQQQLTAITIVQREGEHAGEALDAIDAPLLPGMQDGLGIRACPVAMTELFQLGTYGLMIVDLAVEADDDGAALIGHGLLAAGDIDDGQPAMAEGEVRFEMKTVPVRAAMSHRIGHPANPPSRRDVRIQRMKKAGHAAHNNATPTAPTPHIGCQMRWHS